MVLKYRSIESLLSDIDDDFDFSSTDWFSKSIGWTARALEIIGAIEGLKPVNKSITIQSGKGLLPCNIQQLMFFSKDVYHYRVKTDFTCEALVNNPDGYFSNGGYVEINESYVFTQFDSGTIMCHYLSIPVDNCGYPLIIDDAFITEAIGWYITYKLILGGYKHHTIKNWQDAKALWEQAYPRAQNSVNFPKPQDMEKFKNNWTLIAKDDRLIKHYFTV
jgi:hypothetical protein